jgi:hypothetical protein
MKRKYEVVERGARATLTIGNDTVSVFCFQPEWPGVRVELFRECARLLRKTKLRRVI